MSIIEERLRSLRDVDAVQGSVMFSAAGAVIARDCALDAAMLQAAGNRLALLFEAFAVEGEELSGCVLAFAEHRLHLRRVSWGVLGVIAGAEVNVPALHMAMSLVLRRLDGQGPARSAPPPLSASSRAPLPVAAAAGSVPPSTQPWQSQPPRPLSPGPSAVGAIDAAPSSEGLRHVRMYRGRRVLDE